MASVIVRLSGCGSVGPAWVIELGDMGGSKARDLSDRPGLYNFKMLLLSIRRATGGLNKTLVRQPREVTHYHV
jgi:hypothetical protein